MHSKKSFRNVIRTRGYIFNTFNAKVTNDNEIVFRKDTPFPKAKDVLAKNSALKALIS